MALERNKNVSIERAALPSSLAYLLASEGVPISMVRDIVANLS